MRLTAPIPVEMHIAHITINDIEYDLSKGLPPAVIAELQDTEVIGLQSLGGFNSFANGPGLEAQILFNLELRRKGIVKDSILTGACLLQEPMYGMSNYPQIAKKVLSKIVLLLTNKKAECNADAILIQKQIDRFTTLIDDEHFKSFKNKIADALAISLVELKKTSNENSLLLKEVLDQYNDFEKRFSEELTLALTEIGDQWQEEAEEFIVKHNPNGEITLDVTRWFHVYPIESKKEQSTSINSNINFPDCSPTSLKNKIRFNKEDQEKYQEKIKTLYKENSNYKNAVDSTIKSVIKGKKRKWLNMGYSELEIQNNSLEYLIKRELPWIAYLAENQPNIRILYLGDTSLAIKATYEIFHPEKKTCWFGHIAKKINPTTNDNETNEIAEKDEIIEQKNRSLSQPNLAIPRELFLSDQAKGKAIASSYPPHKPKHKSSSSSSSSSEERFQEQWDIHQKKMEKELQEQLRQQLEEYKQQIEEQIQQRIALALSKATETREEQQTSPQESQTSIKKPLQNPTNKKSMQRCCIL